MIITFICMFAFVALMAYEALRFLLKKDEEPWVQPQWRSEERKWD